MKHSTSDAVSYICIPMYYYICSVAKHIRRFLYTYTAGSIYIYTHIHMGFMNIHTCVYIYIYIYAGCFSRVAAVTS